MPSDRAALGQCAFAIVTILSITAIGGLQNLQLTGLYLHQAFWCCVVETAVWCPAEVFTYLMRRNGRFPPRIVQRLAPIIAFIWCERTVQIVTQLVQPFIVHASLSPYLAQPSTTTMTTTNALWGSLAQCVILSCFLQIIHIVSLIVRGVQDEFECYADDLILLNAPVNQTHINRLHALIVVHACLSHLLTTAALYLDRITMGILLTSEIIAQENMEGPEYWAFTVTEGVLRLGSRAHAYWKALEWDDEVLEMQQDQQGELQAGQYTMLWVVISRDCLQCILTSAVYLQKVVPWRFPMLRSWWCCPELAALWPEAELRKFYVESLSGSPPLALVAPWSHAAIRQQHVDLWRRAGLTRDFVLRDYSAVPIRESTEWLGYLCYMVLGRILMVLVYLLEAAFALYFSLFLGYMACMWLVFD